MLYNILLYNTAHLYKRTHSEVESSGSSVDSADEKIVQDQQVIHSTMNIMADKLSQISTFLGFNSSDVDGGDVSDDDMEYSVPLEGDEAHL